jgi:hypothetical protein
MKQHDGRQFPTTSAVLLVLAFAQPVVAQDVKPAANFTTSSLLEICALDDSAAQMRSAEFCEGFILGTGLLYLELRKADVIKAWACAEDLPTLPQIREIFVTWARENPQHLDENAVDGFWRAMSATYPCREP